MERRAISLVVGLVLLSVVAVPASANTVVVGEPDLSVTSPTEPIGPSERASLAVVLTNDGTVTDGDPAKPGYESLVTTAKNVRVRVDESKIDADIDVKTGTLTLGRLRSPDSRELAFALETGNVSPGTYRIPLVVEYTYTRAVNYDRFEQPEFTSTEETVRTSVQLTVEDRPQFEVVPRGENDLFAGDTGTLSFALKNTGTQTARQSSVELTAGAPGLYFGRAANPKRTTSVFVESLAPGERTTFSVRAGATNDVSPGTYPVETVVTYQNQNDVRETSDPHRAGVTVRPERTFAIREVQTERFRVGESEATIRGQVVNTGSGAARNVAVQLVTSGSVTATNGEAAVGDLAPGETKPVSFTVAIAEDAEPGTNSYRFRVEYENANGEVRTTDEPIRKSITVAEERDPFRVVGVSTSVTPGGSAALDVELEYVGEEPVSAVSAKLFANDPLSSSDDGAYLGTLEPGDTATATFRVSAAGSALAKEYAASVEVRYDEADGDTKFTDSLPIGVGVEESEGGPPLVPIAVGGVVVLAVVGYAVSRRI